MPQPLWDDILSLSPDLWIWLGDNIYGDTEDMSELKAAYDLQLKNAEYQQLISTTPVMATWDDHDYGKNDAGNEYAMRDESQRLFADFFSLSSTHPVRQHAGVYHAGMFNFDGIKVKVIMMDTRYFRDAIERKNRRYQPNTTGTMLGEMQWKWLEEELASSDADINIIGSSIQVLSAEHPFEKWANFPHEAEKLLDLINKYDKPVILLSGDRHIAEVSEIELEGYPYPLVDITSSGMTHSYEGVGDEPNALRVSPLIGQKNFGTIRLKDEAGVLTLELTLYGDNGTVFFSRSYPMSKE